MQGNRGGKTVMSHADRGGQAPDQASSGRQTGAAAHAQTDHSEGTHHAASHPTSHTRHGDTSLATAPDRPTRRVLPSPEASDFAAGQQVIFDTALTEHDIPGYRNTKGADFSTP